MLRFEPREITEDIKKAIESISTKMGPEPHDKVNPDIASDQGDQGACRTESM